MNKLFFILISFSFTLTANCQTVDFTFESSNGSYCNPATIVYKQTCTGNPIGFLWAFGNDTYSDKPIDSSFYPKAGTYTVKLVAIFESGTLGIIKTVVITASIKPAISVDKNYLCKPGVINFTGSGGANVTNYEWNFGDSTPIVNTPSNTISHSFANFGTDTVILKTTSSSGCSDTTSTVITIEPLPMSIDIAPVRGCVPANVSFTGNVTLPDNSSVTNYTWNFGDGSAPFISTTNTAAHTYSTAGDYFPALTVNSTGGCTRTYNYNKLYFGTPPANGVVYAQTNPVCGSDSVVFIAKATNANRYYWLFGDGTNASSLDTIIKHKYNTIGNKSVRVKPYYNECDAPSLPFTVSIIGVIAKYGFSNTCLDKNTYSFRDTSSGIPTSRLWSFGDGNQQTGIVTPVNSFPTSGEFKTTLTLHDTVSGCSDTTYRIIYTALPKLYNDDSLFTCKNKAISFSIQNNYTDTSARYTWNLFDSQTGPVSNDTITVVANNLGSFNNFVIISRGPESCPDTVRSNNPLLVSGPSLNFTAPGEICLNASLMVTNNSQPFIPADSVLHWYWDFGNSVTKDIFQPMPFNYSTDGTYTVKLTAVDKNGCEDSLSKTVLVNPRPFIHIIAKADSICNGQPATLTAVHNNDLLWSPAASISCVTCDTITVTPLVSTRYYATASNSFNCSVRDSIDIKVNMPFNTTVNPADIYICQNEKITVDVNPKGKKILWSPASGLSDATIYNPVITAIQNTVYTATLTDSAGCSNTSSAQLNIHVKPLPFVDAGPDIFYSKGTSFSLAPAYGSNVESYLWTTDDLLSCTNCPMPNGIANSNQLYVIKVTSDSGCVSSDSVTIGVDCKSTYLLMPKAFTPNNDNLNDVFYPRTIGIKSIIKFTIYNRQGQVVFEAHNFLPNDKGYGWDGKFKGVNQPMNTYVYTIETICITGERIFKKDSFLLIR